MNIATELVERRKDRRFLAEEGALAVIKPSWPYSTALGQIIDISRGGLSFCCVTGEKEPTASSELTILLADHSFYLGEVPFETVSDFELAKNPFASMTPRRRSLQFGELTPDQVCQLENFIQKHTVGEA